MSLKQIDKESIHQICSGQVILNLSTAAKELVENSIDAKSTNIEIRLKEFGSLLLEVSDNGHGIHPDNYQNLTLKHYTSKIQKFSDIAAIETFGFRGEALSSLCALGDLVISTCNEGQSIGCRIEYDHNGIIKNQTNCARERGTTVSLSNLFCTLPVRQKEFLRNLKKEYNRLIHILQAYCIISSGVRITCYNQTGKIKRQLVLSNSPTTELLDNISCVFGPKQCETILPITQSSGESVAVQHGNISADIYNRFQLNGYISKCDHGCGRSSTDRQFYYFNGRPCDHSKLSKAVNEVYHMYNQHQYPFVILNIETSRDLVDVNVTPDKRQIMIQQEKALITLVKESLIEMYTPLQSQITFCNSPLDVSNKSNKRSLSQSSDGPKQKKLCLMSNDDNTTSKQSNVTKFVSSKSKKNETTNSTGTSSNTAAAVGELVKDVSSNTAGELVKDVSFDSGIEIESPQTDKLTADTPSLKIEQILYDTDRLSSKDDMSKGKLVCDMDKIATRLSSMNKECSTTAANKRKQYFHYKIQPSCNRDAEEELKKELSKEDFLQMDTLGQFNLGFIITKLDNNLFIVDQHASDEKYNFEKLKKETVIEHQTLLQPLPLELTAVGESIVKDNLDIFEKNGFRFIFDDNAPPTKRIKLTGKPVSKNWSMNSPEIEELIFLLTDSPGEMVRPQCVTKMLASRSCRSSVMIGTALNKQEMNKLIVHMSEMDQPWNCPHGRPTIRHLLDISRVCK